MLKIAKNCINPSVISLLVLTLSLLIIVGSAGAETPISGGNITANTTWNLAGSPYVVSGDVTVDNGVTLTVDPGVVVKFQSGKIGVHGTLKVVGTTGQKIYFTSHTDDSVGGDTNGDGNATTPSGKEWKGLFFYSDSTGNVLEHAVVRHGGYVYNGSDQLLYANTSSLTIRNSTIEESYSYGIYINDAAPTIEDCTIQGNNSAGIFLKNSTSIIRNNTISGNGNYGIHAQDSTATITGNTISGHVSGYASPFYPIYLYGQSLGSTVSGNTMTGNDINRVVYGGTITESVTLDTDKSPYIVDSWNVDSGAILTLKPGVVLKFKSSFNVNGTLVADGESDSQVYFTSLKDDSLGGDSNEDGSDTTPSSSDWYGVSINQTSSGNVIDNVTIRYASTGLNVYQTPITVSDCTIEESWSGISVSGVSSGNVSITGCTIKNGAEYGIQLYGVESGVTLSGNTITSHKRGLYLYDSPNVTIENNTITDNTEYAVLFQNTPFDATKFTGNTITGNGINQLCLSGTVNESFTLGEYALGNVYVIYDYFTISEGATLTVEPNTILKFGYHCYLTVKGTMKADGTPEKPIYFTSFKDDTLGGDTNGDGDGSSPSSGNWDGLYFESESTQNLLDNIFVEYCGYRYIYSSGSKSAGVSTSTSSLTISNSTIRDSSGNGINITGASPTIENNTIENAATGIRLLNSAATVTGNTITGNTGYPVSLSGQSFGAVLNGNTFSENEVNFPLYSGYIDEDVTLSAGVYVVNSWSVSENVILTLQPGVIIKFIQSASGDGIHAGIDVSGTLKAEGTPEQPIYFTSLKDDSVGGDTNGDGDETTPHSGNWDALSFRPQGTVNILNNVVVRYSGYWTTGIGINTSSITLTNNIFEHGGVIHIENASPPITDCIIRDNGTGINLERSDSEIRGNAIYRNHTGISISSSSYESSSPLITENDIWGNRYHGIYVTNNSTPAITFNEISTNEYDGINVSDDSNPAIANNQIFMNREYGVQNNNATDEYIVNAVQNWWGDSDKSGPHHDTANADGTGNKISDNVTFSPFKTEVETQFSYQNFSENSASTYGALAPPTLDQGTPSDQWTSGKEPDRTAAWHADAVILSYANLEASAHYKVRVSYFDPDNDGTQQSLTDGDGNPIHSTMAMPTSPRQYEFIIPPSSYDDGNLTLRFVNANPGDSAKAVLPEIWLMAYEPDATQPRLEQIVYNDTDDSDTLTAGDTFTFLFTNDIDTGIIKNGTTDANEKLPPTGGTIYGTTNQVQWTDNRNLVLTVSDGFTVTGDETVTPAGLKDISGNPVTGSHKLIPDDASPELTYIRFDDTDGSGTVSKDDRYFFGFSEPMRSAPLSGTVQANTNLPPGDKIYGNVNSAIVWNSEFTECIVKMTEGVNVTGSEVVDPTDDVTDRTDNPVSNTMALTTDDTIRPELSYVQANYNSPVGAVTDYRLTIRFNTSMDANTPPTITMVHSGNTAPVISGAGTWQKTAYENDTYVTPDIDLTDIPPGSIDVSISGAADVAGNSMDAADDVYQFSRIDDNDLPDTQITSGVDEGGMTCSADTIFCWNGTDNSASASGLNYSWKLDDGDWSVSDTAICRNFTGLSDGDHMIQIRAEDASGNTDPSPAIRNFNVNTGAPVISDIKLSKYSDNATISWQTDKPATSQVEYGDNDGYGNETPLKSALVKEHSITIENIDLQTDHHYRIKSKDACGIAAVSEDYVFSATPDGGAPSTKIISGPSGEICATDVEFCWSGSDDSTQTGNLTYSYRLDTQEWPEQTSETCFQLTGLSEGSHTFQVRATDVSGNTESTPAESVFSVNTSSPVISGINIVERQSGASITWTTSKASGSQVEYGLTAEYGNITQEDNRKVEEHRVVLSGLEPETTYHFRAISSDGCNEVRSEEGTFTTTGIQPANLTASYLDIPPSATPGSEAIIKWRVRNDGQGDAEGEWKDRLYLSSDDTLGEDDTLLDEFPKTGGLTGYFDYRMNETILIPAVETGPYYIILKTDADGMVTESDETNNIAVRPIDITNPLVMTATPDVINLTLTPNVAQNGELKISNVGDAPLTGISATVEDASANITIQTTVPSDLDSQVTKTFQYKVTVADASVLENKPTIKFTSSEGAESTVALNLYVIPPTPKLEIAQETLETGMVRGKQRIFEFDIFNAGGASANDLLVLVPQAPWLKLTTPKFIGNIASAQKVTVGLILAPAEDLTFGPYTGDIVISGSNANLKIPFEFTAVSEAKGGLKVTVTDEFTYFAEDKPNLAGATITLKDVFTGDLVAEGVSDETGAYLIQDIAEATYELEVKAEKHGTFKTSVKIEPGVEKDVEAFLPRQFVTYSWSVVPVEIEDNYRVTLEAEFETHVPAPVITVEPRIQVVPFYQGEPTTIEVTLTNHGLISAQGAKIEFPESEEYDIFPLIDSIGEIPPMSSVTVPIIFSKRQDVVSIKNSPKRREKRDNNSKAPANNAVCNFLSGTVKSYYYCGKDRKWHVKKIKVKPADITKINSAVAGIGKGLECVATWNPSACLNYLCTLLPEIASSERFKGSDVEEYGKNLSCMCAIGGALSISGALTLAECIACSETLSALAVELADYLFPDGDYNSDGEVNDQDFWYLHVEGQLREGLAGYSPGEINWPQLPFFTTTKTGCAPNDDVIVDKEKRRKEITPSVDIKKYGGRIIKHNVIGEGR